MNPDDPATPPDPTPDTARPSGDPAPPVGIADRGAEVPPYPTTEPALRKWEGLARDAVILACRFDTTAPMRLPTDVWGLQVVAVDIPADSAAREVDLFAGCWLPEQDPAAAVDGQVVVRLHPPAPRPGPTPDYDPTRVDVELLLAYQGQWVPAGLWLRMGIGWPRLVAPTAAIVLRLHTDLDEAACGADHRAKTPGWTPAREHCDTESGALAPLLQAGLVAAGDELEWVRNKGQRHTARVRADERIELADGRVFATVSASIKAVGGWPSSVAWRCWRRVSDHRTLDELRTQLRRQTEGNGPKAAYASG